MKKNHLGLLTLMFLIPTCLAGCGNKTSDLPANKVRVSFDTCTELETNLISDQIIEKGTKATEPEVIFPMDLNKQLKVFAWYKEKTYESQWDFSSPVNESMTLYAKWAETCTVKYYLKGSDTPIWTISNIIKGKPLELHEELCDGYEFKGYFSDKECLTPFNLETPINADTTVYLNRSETISLNPNSIKRRFRMVAAGGSGSTAGTIGEVVTKENESYIDVNFGYSRSKDPYMNITNPQINISKSQKLKVTFKNMGGADNIKFYWVAKLADGTFVNSRQSFSEDNAWNYSFAKSEMNMKDEDPWLVKEFDLSSKIIKGVSSWANCVTLVSLRIQAGYLSKSSTDLSNIFRFKSIDGISDETYKGYNDSPEVKSYLQDSSPSELADAADKQVQPANGFIFPKNNETQGLINFESTEKYFKNVEGLVLYSKYDKTSLNKYSFKIKDAHISIDTYSLVKFRIKNLSYVETLNVNIITLKEGSTARTVTSSKSIPITYKDNDFNEYELNFYDIKTIVGDIQEISFTFNNNGVDNAIILESFWFDVNKSFQSPGINFDSKEFGGFVSTDDIKLSVQTDSPTTKFEVLNDNASISRSFPNSEAIDLSAYSTLTFKVYKPTGDLSQIKIKITVNDVTTEYTVNQFEAGLNTVSLPFDSSLRGILKKVEFTFDKVGTVKISSLIFGVNRSTSIDFNNGADSSNMLSDWAAHIHFNDSKNAVLYNAQVDATTSNAFRYYFGYLYGQAKRDSGNIPLADKTTIHLIYQNPSSNASFQSRLYGVNKEENPNDYETAFSESHVLADLTFTLKTKMSEFEWAVASIDLTKEMAQYLDENWLLSNLNGRIDGGNSSMNFYIRALVIE